MNQNPIEVNLVKLSGSTMVNVSTQDQFNVLPGGYL
jgi:hypothetical protein